MYSTTNVLLAAKGGHHRLSDRVDFNESADIPASLIHKVLVVDDNNDLADMTGLLLNAYGVDSVVVYSAQDALDALQLDGKIDAVISDIIMPGMNGVRLAGIIEEAYPTIKIVLTSGYAKPAVFDACGRDYLFATKPYAMYDLLKLLRS